MEYQNIINLLGNNISDQVPRFVTKKMGRNT